MSTVKRLVIFGSGGYGRTVKDVAEQLGYSTIALDDADPAHPLSTFYPILMRTPLSSLPLATMLSGWNG